MNTSEFKNITTLAQIKNMIGLSDWEIFQIIGESEIIMLSPDNRYYLSIQTDLLNSASNKLTLTDRFIDRTITNKQRIKNHGFKDLYNLVRLLKHGIKL